MKIFNYIAVVALTAATLAGCKKDDTSLDSSLPYEPSESTISFSSLDSAATTKGHICDSTNPLDTMEINAYYTKQSLFEDAAVTDIDQFMTHQFVKKTGDDWIYSPIKYWPNNTGDKVSFFSTSPYQEIECKINPANGKPRFFYEASPFAHYNDDLLMGTIFDASKSDGEVNFEMKHLLTRINLEVAAINAPEVDADGQTISPDSNPDDGIDDSHGTGEYDVEYSVNGITFNDILIGGEVTYSTDGTFSWVVDTSKDLYISASQGGSLISNDDPTSVLQTTSKANSDINKYTYNNVCRPGMAIFMMPQKIENNEYGTETPTVQLRLRKSYIYYSAENDGTSIGTRINAAGETEYKYQGEVIYVPDPITLPTPDTNGWIMGENITMRFIYDLSAKTPMPLTVLSMIYDYSDVDLDINIDNNIYIYSDKNDVFRLNSTDNEVAMNIYTNYPHDLTEPDHKEELDGTITTSNGLVFFSDYNTNDDYWIPEAVSPEDVVDGYKKYKVTSSENSDYVFYYWLKKSTRTAEGCYVGPDATGVNQYGTDAVYLLKLEIDNAHLTLHRCDEDGTPNTNGEYGSYYGHIGVEMLSNAGGLITKLFPLSVIKKL